jgi:hypothetical protein
MSPVLSDKDALSPRSSHRATRCSNRRVALRIALSDVAVAESAPRPMQPPTASARLGPARSLRQRRRGVRRRTPPFGPRGTSHLGRSTPRGSRSGVSFTSSARARDAAVARNAPMSRRRRRRRRPCRRFQRRRPIRLGDRSVAEAPAAAPLVGTRGAASGVATSAEEWAMLDATEVPRPCPGGASGTSCSPQSCPLQGVAEKGIETSSVRTV